MSPSSSSPSSTTTSPSSSKPNDASPKNDSRTLITITILSIAAFLLIGYIVYLTLRLKRRQLAESTEAGGGGHGPYHGAPADGSHIASRISPFASESTSPGGVVPRFQRTPGSDMRIAIRRPDGAWHFADSRTPFTPSGVSDIDVIPSPSSSTSFLPWSSRADVPSSPSSTSFLPWSSRTNVSKKEMEVKAMATKGYGGREFDVNVGLVPPPPAYTHEDGNESLEGHLQPHHQQRQYGQQRHYGHQ
ncbi:hypothetical protein K443DRAFT_674880 [Laccaria amethystina LaAM-08-1]|uniref:Uncharacterized protein n=1 Tax=Laccaria amethystina LaAM-08-1 TaxID=1095629 RepID=A0A0C9XW74_9AGAR|nr:hypothetical protein K443DRAFT_674880 [Laccaria amethystina LaAM-08-1]